MMMIENTPENRQKLAEETLDSMDVNSVMECAMTSLINDFESDDDYFQEQWEWMEMVEAGNG